MKDLLHWESPFSRNSTRSTTMPICVLVLPQLKHFNLYIDAFTNIVVVASFYKLATPKTNKKISSSKQTFI